MKMHYHIHDFLMINQYSFYLPLKKRDTSGLEYNLITSSFISSSKDNSRLVSSSDSSLLELLSKRLSEEDCFLNESLNETAVFVAGETYGFS